MTDHSDNREKATHTLEKAEQEMRMKNEAGDKSDEGEEASKQADDASPNSDDIHARDANPPRTTTGWFTAPKFGSASSGGGEIEPGPERD